MITPLKSTSGRVHCLIFILAFSIHLQHSCSHNLSSDISKSRSGYVDGYQHDHHHPLRVVHTTSHHAGYSTVGGYSFLDIVLTGLAVMSFGIYLLNLLLNAILAAQMSMTTTSTTMPPMMTGTGTGRSERGKRDVFLVNPGRLLSMETLAASVLNSIDALVAENECVHKVYCEANKSAKVIGSGFEYLMPAYSLSSSYISRKIGLHDTFLSHLRAVSLGYFSENCQAHYPLC